MPNTPMSTKYFKDSYKGILSSARLYDYIKEKSNKNLPLEFVIMVASTTIYQIHNYLIDNPEKINDTEFMGSVTDYIYHLLF